MKSNEHTNYPGPMELIELFKSKSLSSQFCIVPFTNMIFNPSGDVGICRQKGTEHIVGNIKDETISDIWNNTYLQKWRHEFLTGDIEICKDEIKNDFCHLSGDNYTLFPEIDLSVFQKKMPLKLTANFNGQCNLKCTMCDVWMMENGLYDRIGFWERAQEEFFPYIKEIELLSGEPFIQKDTYRLIDLISESNPDVLWSFTTNGHWKFNKKIEEALSQIKIKNIIYSIDSLEPHLYSKIRKGGRLEVVLTNLREMKKYEKKRKEQGLGKLHLSLHFLVMNNNWHELGEVVNFCEENKLRLTVNNCVEPHECSISSYDEDKRLEIAFGLLNQLNRKQINRGIRFFSSLANSLTKINKASLLVAIKEKL